MSGSWLQGFVIVFAVALACLLAIGYGIYGIMRRRVLVPPVFGTEYDGESAFYPSVIYIAAGVLPLLLVLSLVLAPIIPGDFEMPMLIGLEAMVVLVAFVAHTKPLLHALGLATGLCAFLLLFMPGASSWKMPMIVVLFALTAGLVGAQMYLERKNPAQ